MYVHVLGFTGHAYDGIISRRLSRQRAPNILDKSTRVTKDEFKSLRGKLQAAIEALSGSSTCKCQIELGEHCAQASKAIQ